MFNQSQWQEEQDAWFSRNDRFDGFDRGDVVEIVPASECDQEWEDIEF